MIEKGDSVIFAAGHEWVAERYNFTIGKAYKVISTNDFWCSAKIVNNHVKEMSFHTDRLFKIY